MAFLDKHGNLLGLALIAAVLFVMAVAVHDNDAVNDALSLREGILRLEAQR